MAPPAFRGNPYTAIHYVLQRHPYVDRVRYRPSTAEKQYVEAILAPERLDHAGPDPPRITVRWGRTADEFRVDYADPNVGFHCGWHRDDDHPEYGDVHFQYDYPGTEGPVYEAASVDASTPPRILWELLDRLFGTVLPETVAPLCD